jgi:hypothetical protein
MAAARENHASMREILPSDPVATLLKLDLVNELPQKRLSVILCIRWLALC